MSSGFFLTRGQVLKFPKHGVTHALHISQPVEKVQQSEGGVPLWWDAEQTDPRMQVVVSGYVTEDSLTSDDDDGFRSLYIRAGIQRAVAQACRKANVQAPGPGMILTVTYVSDGHQPDPNRKPPKEYLATIEIVLPWKNDPRFRPGWTARRLGTEAAVDGRFRRREA
jgi:hypothetical protein